MPLESIANVTSICGTPRGAGGMPTRSNLPSDLFSRANSRSPCSTCTCTLFWLSATVVKISEFLVGIVELRSMTFVNTPPCVSTPSDSGVTSSRIMSLMSPRRMPPCTAAPIGDDFVGIDVAVRLLAEDLLHRLDDARHARLAADEHDFVDVLRRARRRLQRVVDRVDRLLDQVLDHLLELAAREDAVEMLRSRGVGGDERQRDARLLGNRQLALGALGRLLETLQGHAVVGEV